MLVGRKWELSLIALFINNFEAEANVTFFHILSLKRCQLRCFQVSLKQLRRKAARLIAVLDHGVLCTFVFNSSKSKTFRHKQGCLTTNYGLRKPPIVYVQMGVNRTASTKLLRFILAVFILLQLNGKERCFPVTFSSGGCFRNFVRSHPRKKLFEKRRFSQTLSWTEQQR